MEFLRRIVWTGLGILPFSAALAQAGPIDVHGGGGTFVSTLPGEPPQGFQTNTLIYSFLDDPPSYSLGRAVFEFNLANLPGDSSLGHIELSLHQRRLAHLARSRSTGSTGTGSSIPTKATRPCSRAGSSRIRAAWSRWT